MLDSSPVKLHQAALTSETAESSLLLSPPPSSPQHFHPVNFPLPKPACSKQLALFSNHKLTKKQHRKRRGATVKDWNLSTLLTTSRESGGSFDFSRLTERQQLAMTKKRALLEQEGALSNADEKSILKTISPFVLDKIDDSIACVAVKRSKQANDENAHPNVVEDSRTHDAKLAQRVKKSRPSETNIKLKIKLQSPSIVEQAVVADDNIFISIVESDQEPSCLPAESSLISTLVPTDANILQWSPALAAKYSMIMQEWGVFIEHLNAHIEKPYATAIIDSMVPNMRTLRRTALELEDEHRAFVTGNVNQGCSTSIANDLAFQLNSRVHPVFSQLLQVALDELQILELTWTVK